MNVRPNQCQFDATVAATDANDEPQSHHLGAPQLRAIQEQLEQQLDSHSIVLSKRGCDLLQDTGST